MVSRLALITALAGLVAAQTPSSCSVSYSGYLGTRKASNTEQPPETYIGTIDGVTSTGLDGAKDNIIVSQYKNGTALTKQPFEFLTCSDQNGHAFPPGYSPPTSGPTNDYYGILRPSGNKNGCLTVGSKNDNSTGAKNTILLAQNCSKVAARYRTFVLEDYIYGENSYGMRLFYAAADDTALITNTAHKQVVLLTNDKAGDSAALQLMLLDGQE